MMAHLKRKVSHYTFPFFIDNNQPLKSLLGVHKNFTIVLVLYYVLSVLDRTLYLSVVPKRVKTNSSEAIKSKISVIYLIYGNIIYPDRRLMSFMFEST